MAAPFGAMIYLLPTSHHILNDDGGGVAHYLKVDIMHTCDMNIGYMHTATSMMIDFDLYDMI